MIRRALGTTGCELSIIGFGGMVVRDATPAEASSIVAEAIDAGVNYVDVAPSYGNAEERLGPALEPYRDRVFLACKTSKRTKAEAGAELRDSLRRMRTGHFDLYQLHAMTTREDLETALGPGGALEAFVEARDQGLIRFIGFSAHSQEIATELLERFPFASMLFPINFMEFFVAGFGPEAVARAVSHGAGRLALKAMARQSWPEGAPREEWPKCWYEPLTDPRQAALALRWTLSQPITAAVPPGDWRLFRLALKTGSEFQPVTQEEEAELRRMATGLSPFFAAAA